MLYSFDNIAGDRLISLRRVVLVSVVIFFIALYHWWQSNIELEDGRFWIVLALSWINCTLSLSITRYITRISVKFINDGVLQNIILFAISMLVNLAIFDIWRPAADQLNLHISFTLLNLIQGEWGELEFSIFGELVGFLREVIFDIIWYHVFNPLERLNNLINFLSGDINQMATTFSFLIRFLFAFVFVIGFVSEYTVRRPLLNAWAYLVEQDKPVFTVAFGAFGALCKGISTH